MSRTDAALEIWNQMTPMQRYEVMRRVGQIKSVNKRFRACIALIASELP